MEHDDVVVPTFGTSCINNQGRMGRRLDSFSSCSVEWVRLKFMPGSQLYNTVNYPACVETRDYAIISGTAAKCGNGIIEPGEQCDCPNNDCTGIDSCCQGSICQLKAGATCTPTKDGCCNPQTCSSPLARGTVCRASTGSCDITETCDGSSVSCPTDSRKPLGTTCTTSALKLPGVCNCDGCTSTNEKCRLADPMYGVCSWTVTGDDACGTQYCDIGTEGSCSTWGDTSALGYTCGSGMGCSGDNKCVPLSAITCPWMLNSVIIPKTPSPTVSVTTGVTTRTPTARATRTPTKYPTRRGARTIVTN